MFNVLHKTVVRQIRNYLRSNGVLVLLGRNMSRRLEDILKLEEPAQWPADNVQHQLKYKSTTADMQEVLAAAVPAVVLAAVPAISIVVAETVSATALAAPVLPALQPAQGT